MLKKIIELSAKRQALTCDLVAPARAAANQMKDAGMAMGAGPLLEILFQIDAADQELKDLIGSHPLEAVEALKEMMRGSR